MNLSRRIEEFSENLHKERETIKKTVKNEKHITEMKNTLDGINSRLETEEDQIID